MTTSTELTKESGRKLRRIFTAEEVKFSRIDLKEAEFNLLMKKYQSGHSDFMPSFSDEHWLNKDMYAIDFYENERDMRFVKLAREALEKAKGCDLCEETGLVKSRGGKLIACIKCQYGKTNL